MALPATKESICLATPKACKQANVKAAGVRGISKTCKLSARCLRPTALCRVTLHHMNAQDRDRQETTKGVMPDHPATPMHTIETGMRSQKEACLTSEHCLKTHSYLPSQSAMPMHGTETGMRLQKAACLAPEEASGSEVKDNINDLVEW